MFKRKPKVDFHYVSNGEGTVNKFKCKCGNEIESEQNREIKHGDRLTCQECGFVYEYQWEGFSLGLIGYDKAVSEDN